MKESALPNFCRAPPCHMIYAAISQRMQDTTVKTTFSVHQGTYTKKLVCLIMTDIYLPTSAISHAPSALLAISALSCPAECERVIAPPAAICAPPFSPK